MKKLWRRISFLGVRSEERNLYNRTLILGNQLNVIMLISVTLVFILLMIINWIQQTSWGIGSQRILMMMILNVINLVLASRNHAWLSKISLIFILPTVFFIIPTMLGFVEEESFAYYPYIIITFSSIPQILLVPVRERVLYYFSFTYFGLLLLFIEPFLKAYMPREFEIVPIIENFYLMHKVTQVIGFIFLHIAIYQLRRINIRFQEEITHKNKALTKQNIELNNTLRSLDEAQKKLYQSERMTSLGTLTAGMAHEINNPLNYISGGLAMIEEVKPGHNLDKKSELHDDFTNGIQIIRKGFEKAKKIVDALMTFTGNENPKPQWVDLHELIDNTIFFMRHKFPEELKVRKNYRFLGPVLAYKDKLQQVLLSIVDNAVAAINSMGERKNEYIDIETYRDNSDSQDYLVVKITNTGPEIPENDLPHIFDPFFTTKETGIGTGLGLTIAYAFINDHNGVLSAENTGSGVCFRIRFPVLESEV